MKRIALIFATLFVLVIGISCVSAASLDVDCDAVASEAPALLGNGLGGGLGGGLGTGLDGGLDGCIGSGLDGGLDGCIGSGSVVYDDFDPTIPLIPNISDINGSFSPVGPSPLQ